MVVLRTYMVEHVLMHVAKKTQAQALPGHQDNMNIVSDECRVNFVYACHH